jgi:Bacterial Peptidase A24 N-terminal domain.
MLQELDTLLYNTYFLCFLVGTIGLMVGSFLNVVIYRLPIMLKNSWQEECKLI